MGAENSPWTDASPQGAPVRMPLFDTTQLGLERAISGAAQRQTALASNVANANTPGYKPKDVDFHSALQSAFASGAGAKEVASTPFAETTQTGTMRPDGSGVDVDVESAKLSQNALE